MQSLSESIVGYRVDEVAVIAKVVSVIFELLQLVREIGDGIGPIIDALGQLLQDPLLAGLVAV
jgi:hypothetical protein